ncbi:MAG: hypothetical protein ACM3H7_02655 [Acidobacteriaceae bacterium]
MTACARQPALTPAPTARYSSEFVSKTPSPSPFPTLIPAFSPSPSIPSPTSALEPPAQPGPLVHAQPGPIYDTVIQIPVGEQGIQYRGAGMEDMQPVGPNGLVITREGQVIVGDVFGNRLIRYDISGNRLPDIDLASLGIYNISDLVGIDDHLYILEISFQLLPERYRVNELTTAGAIVSQYDLPAGFHFEDGLFGLASGYLPGGSKQLLIQLDNADNSAYYALPGAPGGLPQKLPARPVFGADLKMHSGGSGERAVLSLGSREYESRMTTGGTIFLLEAFPDGSLYLEREDLLAWEPVITTDITIHYISSAGEPQGVARYPLMDWYFPIFRFLAVGPDGNVYALITREKSVDVLRLNFYNALAPIYPAAAEPVVTLAIANPTPDTMDDCSSVQHYAPDSPEAQQVVESYLANFHQDWPTEYMAFEQLWSVDRMGEYVVIQGMVTQEEADIIIAHETERGLVLISRYTSHMVLPGNWHGDIRGYLQSQLPAVPTELVSCLDLSHFTGPDE